MFIVTGYGLNPPKCWGKRMKDVASTCVLRAAKIRLRPGLRPRPRWGSFRSSQTPSWIWEGRGREGKGREEKGRRDQVLRRKEGRGRSDLQSKSWLQPWLWKMLYNRHWIRHISGGVSKSVRPWLRLSRRLSYLCAKYMELLASSHSAISNSWFF